jgi:hypothetical protein
MLTDYGRIRSNLILILNEKILFQSNLSIFPIGIDLESKELDTKSKIYLCSATILKSPLETSPRMRFTHLLTSLVWQLVWPAAFSSLCGF